MRFFISSLLKFFILAPTLVSGHRYKMYEEAAMIVKKINKPALLTIESIPKQWLKQKSGEWRDGFNEAPQIWLRNGTRCPKHSVPIRRITTADVMRTNLITQVGEKHYSNYRELINKPNLREYATVIHKAEEGVYGAKARLNVWQPFVEGLSEFSLAQIWVVSGPDDEDLNSIEVGWHVYPWLYGDDATRFFIFWTHQETGDWWLTVGDTVVGYWPVDIFTGLKGAATRVEWGGEVINTATNSRGRHTKTQMGSGHFADEGYRKASYFDRLEIVTKDDEVIPVKTVSKEVTNDQCYSILVYPYDDELGTGFLYGGPGYNESACKN